MRNIPLACSVIFYGQHAAIPGTPSSRATIKTASKPRGNWQSTSHTDQAVVLAKVFNVADGDTITVLDETNTQHKIRLTGIDAPEKRQAFDNVSKQSLADMVAGQSVAVE